MTFWRAVLISAVTNVAAFAMFIFGLMQKNVLFILLVLGAPVMRFIVFWRTRCHVCGKSVFDAKTMPLSINQGWPEQRCSKCGVDFARGGQPEKPA